MDEEVISTGSEDQTNEVVNDEVLEEVTEEVTDEPISTKKKIKYTIDGQDIEEELDEDELVKGYQYSKAAGKKFQEAAQMRKQAETLIKVMQADPSKVFKELGMDPREWAEKYLVGILQEEQMDPKEKELLQYKRQLEALEAEKKTQQESQQKQVYDQLVTHYQQDFEKQIIDALNTSGLPRSEHTVSRMAYYMSKALDAGLEDVSFADVVPLVKNDYEQEVRSLFGTSDIDKLMNLIGEEPIKKIRNYELDKLKSSSTVQGGKSTPKPKEESKEPVKKLSPEEWRAELNRRVGG